MNELRTWVITLVTVTLLCNLVEKFAPQGNLNKYVRLVCGLSVTIVIAMPLIQFFKGDFDLGAVAWNDYVQLSEGELKRRIEKQENEDFRQILEVYRKTLINDIKSRFKAEKGYVVTYVDAVLDEDPKGSAFGAIRALYLTLVPGSQNSSKTLSPEKLDAIKNELAKTFEMDKEKILIETSQFTGGG